MLLLSSPAEVSPCGPSSSEAFHDIRWAGVSCRYSYVVGVNEFSPPGQPSGAQACLPVGRLNVFPPACVPKSKTVIADLRYVELEGKPGHVNERRQEQQAGQRPVASRFGTNPVARPPPEGWGMGRVDGTPPPRGGASPPVH